MGRKGEIGVKHPSKNKRICLNCGEHPALFIAPNGSVKSDDQHDLCMKCYRALLNATRPVKGKRR